MSSIDVLNVTDTAKIRFKEMIDQTKRPNLGVRVRINETRIELMFAAPEDRAEEDVIQNTGNFDLIFDSASAERLMGGSLDIEEEGISINPAPGKNLFPTSKEWGEPIADAVQNVIDQQLNPGLSGHGGWVKLLEIKDDTAYIEMGGGCKGCMHSYMTLKSTIETTIIEKVPQIKNVIDTTDHADGTNPYYSPEG